ncbi:MAG: glycosyltransferase family 39 protein, partial [Rhodoferax sp.]|nr:glycosyltransferase family 39 protein [Rhodoferax sp.]
MPPPMRPPMPPGLRWLLALLVVLHAGLGASLGLSVDEAHYALYAAHPALSYFDHPPLVGWVQWPLVALHAPDYVLRLLPGLLWLATVLLVWRVTLRLCADAAHRNRAACAAVLALLLAPLLHILGIGLLPDTLLMLWSVALLWQTIVLLDAAAVQRPAPWLVLGLLLGLAGLSKYTAILSAAAVALCLLHGHG